MAQTKVSDSMGVSEIQRQMAQIRHELHAEVAGAVQGAQSLTDWRSLVKSWPWLSLGAAALAGYLVVPTRRREAPAISFYTPAHAASPPAVPQDRAAPVRVSPGAVLGTAVGLLAPVLVRAAQSYAAAYLESWLAGRFLAPAAQQEPAPSSSGRQAAPGGPAVIRLSRDR